MQVQSLGWEDTLEEGMATHSMLENLMDREGSLVGYSPRGHRVGHNWVPKQQQQCSLDFETDADPSSVSLWAFKTISDKM